MKYLLALFLLAGLLPAKPATAQFSQYFLDKTLRFDYYHCGDSRTEEYYFDELKSEPYWAGSKTTLVDDTGYGVQLFKIIDIASGKEIYSRSFNTLFNEWQMTEEAAHVRKAMPESVVFPFPKNPVRLEIYSRNKKGVFEKKFEQEIDPQSLFIRPFSPRYETFEVMYMPPMRKRLLWQTAGNSCRNSLLLSRINLWHPVLMCVPSGRLLKIRA